MKQIFKYMLGSLLMVTALISCKKDENKVFFEGGTAPVLGASLSTTIPLSYVNRGLEAITFNWTNPNYKFTTGVNSQNVTYTWELDTMGANFTNPKKKQLSISGDLSRTFTQGDFNDYLLNQLELAPGMSHNLEVRVKASIAGSNPTVLVSNTLSFAVVPFAIPPKVTPPASGRLFMVGAATPGGWNNPVPTPAQEFTQVNSTLYTLTLNLSASNSYLFLPVNGSWDAKYGCLGGNNSNNPDGDEFRPGGGDMVSPAVGGNYKIEVNFQQGKFKLTKL
ncbi:MAG: hypothetical protein RLY16_2080 [Bacteroidota bacterium]|jgi:hypothetical protein